VPGSDQIVEVFGGQKKREKSGRRSRLGVGWWKQEGLSKGKGKDALADAERGGGEHPGGKGEIFAGQGRRSGRGTGSNRLWEVGAVFQ